MSELLENAMSKMAGPGLNAGIAQGQEFALTFADHGSEARQGLAPARRFDVGDLLDPLLGLICCELHVSGRLDLAEPISSYLPELGRGQACEITVGHLLSHTAGYVEPRAKGTIAIPTWEALAAFFSGRDQAFPPGEVWSYAPTGYVILHRLIRTILSADPDQVVDLELLAPCGIDSHAARAANRRSNRDRDWVVASVGKGPSPDAAIFADRLYPRSLTMADIVKVSTILGGVLLPPFISTEAYALFAKTVVTLSRTVGELASEAPPIAYGQGLAHFHDGVGSSGSTSAATCAVRFDTGANVGVGVVIGDCNPALGYALTSQLMSAALGKLPAASAEPIRFEPPWESLGGSYRALMLGAGTAHVTAGSNAVSIVIIDDGLPAREMLLSCNERGEVALDCCDAPDVSVGFYQRAGEPVLQIGRSAYKRIRALPCRDAM